MNKKVPCKRGHFLFTPIPVQDREIDRIRFKDFHATAKIKSETFRHDGQITLQDAPIAGPVQQRFICHGPKGFTKGWAA